MTAVDPRTARTILDLVTCLEEEYQALLAQDAARLEQVLTRKRELLSGLAELSAVAGSPMAAPRSLPPAVQRAIARVRDLNTRNAAALSPRLAANRTRLRFLQAALGPNQTYTAAGTISDAPGGRARARVRA